MDKLSKIKPIYGDDLPTFSLKLRELPEGFHFSDLEISPDYTPLSYNMKNYLCKIAEHHYRNFEIVGETSQDFLENLQDSWYMESEKFEARLKYIDGIDFDIGQKTYETSITDDTNSKTNVSYGIKTINSDAISSLEKTERNNKLYDSKQSKQNSDNSLDTENIKSITDINKSIGNNKNTENSNVISEQSLENMNYINNGSENIKTKNSTEKINNSVSNSFKNIEIEKSVSNSDEESEHFDTLTQGNKIEQNDKIQSSKESKVENGNIIDKNTTNLSKNVITNTKNNEENQVISSFNDTKNISNSGNTSETDNKNEKMEVNGSEDLKNNQVTNTTESNKIISTGTTKIDDKQSSNNQHERFDIDLTLDALNDIPHSKFKTIESNNQQALNVKSDSEQTDNDKTALSTIAENTVRSSENSQITSVNNTKTGTRSENSDEKIIHSEAEIGVKDNVSNSNATETGKNISDSAKISDIKAENLADSQENYKISGKSVEIAKSVKNQMHTGESTDNTISNESNVLNEKNSESNLFDENVGKESNDNGIETHNLTNTKIDKNIEKSSESTTTTERNVNENVKSSQYKKDSIESIKRSDNEITGINGNEKETKTENVTNSDESTIKIDDKRNKTSARQLNVSRLPNEYSIDVYNRIIEKYPNLIQDFIDIFKNNFIIYDYLTW